MKTKVVQTQIRGAGYYPGSAEWVGSGGLPGKLKFPQQLRLVREPNNPKDGNAISVWVYDQQLGHLARDLAARIAPCMDLGFKANARKSRVQPGGDMIDVAWETGEL